MKKSEIRDKILKAIYNQMDQIDHILSPRRYPVMYDLPPYHGIRQKVALAMSDIILRIRSDLR
jgi:hypothetical protein